MTTVDTHPPTTVDPDPWAKAGDELVARIALFTLTGRRRNSTAEMLDNLERVLARRADSLYDHTLRPRPAMPARTATSTNDITTNGLPEGATGIHWTDTNWTECADHIEDQSWATQVDRSDALAGVVLFDKVDCNACAERDAQ